MANPTHGMTTAERPGRVGLADASVEARFGRSVTVRSDGCWEFRGDLFSYHRFARTRGDVVSAHRFAYETLVGPIDEGLHLHHKCQRPGCVNPDHLEPLTPKEHKAAHRLLDALLKRKGRALSRQGVT